MRPAPLRAVLLLLLLLFAGRAGAQHIHRIATYPRIVKDNIACLYGLKDKAGKWILPPAYTDIREISAGYFRTLLGSKYGLLDTNGRQILLPVYESVSLLASTEYIAYGYEKSVKANAGDMFLVRTKTGHGMANRQGQLVLQPEWERITALTANRFSLRRSKESGYGLCDEKGTLLLPEMYAYIECKRGRMVILANSSYGVADLNGKILVAPQYGKLEEAFADQYIATSFKDGERRQGVVTVHNDTLVPFLYDHVWMCSNTAYGVRIEKRCGFYDNKGTLLQAAEYEMTDGHCFKQYYWDDPLRKLCIAKWKGKAGVLKDYAQWQIPPLYDSIVPGRNGCYAVKLNGLWGVTDTSGKLSAEPQFESVRTLHAAGTKDEAYWKVKRGGKCGLLNMSGKIIYPAEYDSIYLYVLERRRGRWEKSGPKIAHVLLIRDKACGLGSVKGQVLEPCRNDSLLIVPGRTDQPHFLLFRSGEKLTAFNPNDTLPSARTDFRFLCRLDKNVLVYGHDKKEVLAFAANAQGFPAAQWSDRISVMPGLEYGVYIVDHGRNFFILDKNGRLWMGPSKIHRIFRSTEYGSVMVVTPKMRTGLLDPRQPRFLVDTTFEAVSEMPGPRGTFWVKPKLMRGACKAREGFFARANTLYEPERLKKFSRKKRKNEKRREKEYRENAYCLGGWALADSAGKMITEPIFAAPFNPYHQKGKLLPAWGNQGMGLFDTRTLQFVTPAIYCEMDAIGTELFRVRTFSKRCGVIDAKGNLLCDTVWQSAEMIFTNRLEWSERNGKWSDPVPLRLAQLPELWLLQNDTQRMIIDAKGKTYAQISTVDSLRRWALHPEPKEDKLFGRYDPCIRSVETLPGLDSVQKKIILRHAADEILRYHDKHYTCRESSDWPHCLCYSASKKTSLNAEAREIPCDGLIYEYHLGDLRPQGYSIRIKKRYADHYRNGNPHDELIAYQRTANGFRKVTLDNLFSGDTLSAINGLLKEAIRERDDLDLNCTTVENLYKLTTKQFTANEKGLTFHLVMPTRYSGERDYNEYKELLIPWEKMKPFAKEGSLILDQLE